MTSVFVDGYFFPAQLHWIPSITSSLVFVTIFVVVFFPPRLPPPFHMHLPSPSRFSHLLPHLLPQNIASQLFELPWWLNRLLVLIPKRFLQGNSVIVVLALQYKSPHGLARK